jgi:hypothetical protein
MSPWELILFRVEPSCDAHRPEVYHPVTFTLISSLIQGKMVLFAYDLPILKEHA